MFTANAAWLSIAAMAHNLVRAAGALASLPFARARAATIRRDLIAVAVRTARHGRGHLTLHLPEGWHREHEWLNLLHVGCGSPAVRALTSPDRSAPATPARATRSPPPSQEPRTRRRTGERQDARARTHPGKLPGQESDRKRATGISRWIEAKGQSDPLGREPGEWLVSARGRTAAEWEQIKIQAGSRVFTALYQGRPSPDLGSVWQRQWWRRYYVPPWSQHPDVPGAYWVDEADELVMSFDCSFKDTRGSDYVAGQCCLRRGADVYLLDQVRKRLSFTDTLTAFAAMAARWPQASKSSANRRQTGSPLSTA